MKMDQTKTDDAAPDVRPPRSASNQLDTASIAISAVAIGFNLALSVRSGHLIEVAILVSVIMISIAAIGLICKIIFSHFGDRPDEPTPKDSA